MSPRRLIALIAAPLVAVAIFVGGVVVGGHPEATGLTRLADPVRSWLLGDSGQDLAGQVLAALERDYYEPIDASELQRASVDGIIASLDDPYTDYLDPDELEQLREHNAGEYFGVGIQVGQRDGAVIVASVFADSPASRAGIRAGDRIVSVDGQRLDPSKASEAISRIRGREGTTVRLVLARGDAAPRPYELERARIKLPVVTARLQRVSGTPIGYLHLSEFTEGAADELRRAIRSLRRQGVRALVLDLRGDPGGLVTEAVGVASAFLPKGSAVATTQGRNSPRSTLRTGEAPVAGDLPLAILVDRDSASASEIVAGALRDHDRGVLVGQRTFGKALVQSTRVLRDGGALKLTTARYLTPKGFDLAGRGLPPTVAAADDPATPADEALQKALATAAARA